MQKIEPEAFVCPTCGRNFFPYQQCEKLMCKDRMQYGETVYSRGTGFLRIKCRLGSYGNTAVINIPPFSTVTYLLDSIYHM